MSKPPYKLTLMSEMKDILLNGYKVVSTFSGCGGSSLGYKLAGFKVLWANEFIPAAQEVYRANHKGTILDHRDIREVTGDDILTAAGLAKGEIDIFDGSPPCSAFSTCGKREEGWGTAKKYSDKSQRVDDLFFEYVRLVKDTQPKTFVAENVSGLVKGKAAQGYFRDIFAQLEAAGYVVKAALMNAAYFGVPQMRERLIFVGVRKDLITDEVAKASFHPIPNDWYYTVGDAFATLAPHDTSGYELKGKKKILWDYCVKHNLRFVHQAHQVLYGNSSWFNFMRCVETFPCPTLTTNNNVYLHATESRVFTLEEYKQLSSFPGDFNFNIASEGFKSRAFERLGRAVPPVMMKAIASHIANNILPKLKPCAE